MLLAIIFAMSGCQSASDNKTENQKRGESNVLKDYVEVSIEKAHGAKDKLEDAQRKRDDQARKLLDE